MLQQRPKPGELVSEGIIPGKFPLSVYHYMPNVLLTETNNRERSSDIPSMSIRNPIICSQNQCDSESVPTLHEPNDVNSTHSQCNLVQCISPRNCHSDATRSRSRSRRLRLHFVAHVRSSSTQAALPNKSASRQESNEFWREASSEAHSHGEEQGFVDTIGKNGDSVQAV